jgi:trehalose-6-phosphate synthase
MNLVAKEYVAAQDPEDPGVLILSRFAGAAETMREAILVNPTAPRTCPTPCFRRWPCLWRSASGGGTP